jgi:uncharacterized protein
MSIIVDEKKLSSYFFNKTRRGLLTLLFSRPDESLYVNQILRLLKNGAGAVQRELRMATEAGIVVKEKKGNLVYYRTNKQCPIFNELKSIIDHTVLIEMNRFPVPSDKIAEFCRKHHIKKLALFGSVLREDFRPESDIDVLVEFEPEHIPGFEIVDIEDELSQMAGRKVDLRTPAELSRYFREHVVQEARVQYDAT